MASPHFCIGETTTALSANPVSTEPTTASALIIGLSRDSSQELSPVLINQLADTLGQRSVLREAMTRDGYSDVRVIVSDTEFDLVQRMNQNTVSVAFCSAVAFVTQTGNYDAVFQWRSPGDDYDSTLGRVVHRGVLLAGVRSPLFRDGATTAAIAAAIARSEVAFPTSFHAAAYVEPSLALRNMTQGRLPRPLFLGSSEEVAMNVINGAVEMGAVDANALVDVLTARGIGDAGSSLYRIVLTTPPVPTDPVVFQTKYRPGESLIGRELRLGIRQFFAQIPGHPRLQNTTSQAYDVVRQSVTRLREQ